MRKLLLYTALVASLLIAVGCGSSSVVIKHRAQTFILSDYIKVADLNVADARSAMRESGASEEQVSTIIHDVELYKVSYRSTLRGDSIILSGLVCLPDTSTARHPLRHVQYNHATLAPSPNSLGLGSNDAPSLYAGSITITDSMKKSLEARLFGLGLAGSGYFVTMPDYAGYGQTSTIDHPYMNSIELAIEAADMVIAGRELANVLELTMENGVFLCGWSQGGLVTLAQQRFMEAERKDIPVRASAPLAGPYNLNLWAKSAISAGQNATHQQITLLSWMLYSHLDTTVVKGSDIWVKQIDSQYDAMKKMSKLPIEKVFTAKFIKNPASAINKLLTPSNVDKGWTPKAPIYLNHGAQDQLVQYTMSSQAMAEFQKSGADSISIVSHPDCDHNGALLPYYMFIVETFKK